jgi:multidrug efflux pump subunit AcrB
MRNTDSQDKGPVLTYVLNAHASPMFIQQYAENNISDKLSIIKGVNKVEVYGGTPFEWLVTFDADLVFNLGISADDIGTAINNHFGERVLGIIDTQTATKGINPTRVHLNCRPTGDATWQNIPVKKSMGRIVWLHDIASVRYQEQPPWSYHRINGLNTINMLIYPNDNVNNLTLARKVKKEVEEIKNHLPAAYSLMVAYDATGFIHNELTKIGLRTLFSLIILFLFVLIATRKWRYLLLIMVSILANLLIAVIFYYIFKIEIHLYALAGLTVSFGMLIDNSIIMIDHIRLRGNRKVFLAIMAATLTTIGALSVIFFLKEEQRVNLVDFSLVIITNLSVSMFVSLFFIPALYEKMPLSRTAGKGKFRRKRRVVKASRFYSRSIRFSKRFRWAYALVFILGFGIPVHWLPSKIEKQGTFVSVYNKTLGTQWFSDNAKPILEKVAGGSFRLFTQNVYERSFYAEPGRTKLYVRGAMPEGCTIEQLNDVVKVMENYISRYPEVELFQTSIYNARSASIEILFTEEFEHSGFPYHLKELLTSRAIQLGGLDWSVYGVGRGFSNALHTGYRNSSIDIEGYNYDQLYGYASQLSEKLLQNPRVNNLEITGSQSWNSEAMHEYYLHFNPGQFALNELMLFDFYAYLRNKLYRENLQPVFLDNELQPLSLVSSDVGSFDVWSISNEPLSIRDKQLKLETLGSIQKRKTGNSIHKNNQQYRLVVAYDFVGPNPLARKVREQHIEDFEKHLPLGYRVLEQRYGWAWDKGNKKQYYLLFLVIAIIYFTCSVLLESLRQPLAIIGMIPISFIGVFLTFYLFGINFDQGGFASFILLCGIVVNAGLYILNDFNQMKKNTGRKAMHCYMNAFNHKIVPVMLTILSTILGLIPFVWAGQNEVFWFSFAAGAMGGLVFSLVALFVYLPLFMRIKN